MVNKEKKAVNEREPVEGMYTLSSGEEQQEESLQYDHYNKC